jgi:tetratricopeptide (TPR) repeat protein
MMQQFSFLRGYVVVLLGCLSAPSMAWGQGSGVTMDGRVPCPRRPPMIMREPEPTYYYPYPVLNASYDRPMWDYGYRPNAFYSSYGEGYGMGYGYTGAGAVVDAEGSGEGVVGQAVPRRGKGKLESGGGGNVSVGAQVGDIAKAKRQIEMGDRLFAEGDYRKAYYRYKEATKSSPATAEGFFRQAQAAIAQGRYELAIESIGRGIELNPAWAKSSTRFEKLYGKDQAAWREHLDALVAEAEANPEDANLQFLTGVALYFGGQQSKAEKYLVIAQQLGGSSFHLAGFFRELDARAAANK